MAADHADECRSCPKAEESTEKDGQNPVLKSSFDS